MSDRKVITVSIGLGILAFMGILIGPGSFLIHPTFDIQVDKPNEAGIDVTITNTGWVQAKNVKVHYGVIPGAVDFSDCPEYSGFSDGPLESKIFTLERLSQDLPCSIAITTIEPIEKLTVTSDDSPAFVWNSETNESKSDFNLLMTQLGLVITIVASAFVILLQYIKRKKS